ncbi:unnamed protein product [Arabis nemorensis]|uniref:Uncharacterized protein n=1 Tax=Arabis nemorensis TaxID=586526 RepID=A0A565CTA0_9BRAS|nr:unnamed protein product [Arabis nemorensis]
MASPSSSGGGGEGGSSTLAPSSLPPPRPKSPPEYPDLYGKRREAARVQMLEREIGFLEANNERVEDPAGSGSGSGSPSAAAAQLAASLVPNAVTVHAAQTFVVARDRAARAVHASKVAAVLVQIYLAAFPLVSAVVVVDRRV